MRYGMIAGNGRFPLLALEAARKLGHEVVAIAIKEEASPEIEQLAARCHWISLGALSKLIEILQEGRHHRGDDVRAGEARQDLLRDPAGLAASQAAGSLEAKNTDALIGGVAKILADEGIQLVDSTLLLKHLLAGEGVLTRRKPDDEERGYRLWPAHRGCACRASISARASPSRTGLRRRRSDGRHRRDAAPRGIAGGRQTSAAG